MTRDQIEWAVLDEYHSKLGRVIYPLSVDGYCGDDSMALHTFHAIPFLVLPTIRSDLLRWMGDFCDPCWDVRPLDPVEFNNLLLERELEEFRSMWVNGPSYRIGHGREECDSNEFGFRMDWRP